MLKSNHQKAITIVQQLIDINKLFDKSNTRGLYQIKKCYNDKKLKPVLKVSTTSNVL